MIPEFLKRENHPKIERNAMDDALERYEQHFGNGVNTEPSSWTDQQWADILNLCVEEDVTFEEMFGIEYDDDTDY